MTADVYTDDGYFAVIPEWVLYADVSAQAVRLYAVLRRYADQRTGHAHPSRKALAARLAVRDVKTVDRACAELEELGAVTVFARYISEDGRTSFTQDDEYPVQTSNGYLVHGRKNGGGSPTDATTPSHPRHGGSPTDATGVAPQNGDKPEPLEPEPLEPSPSRERDVRAADAEVTTVTPFTVRDVEDPAKLTAAQLEHLFGEFYDAFPRHTGRKAARLAYLKAVKGTKASPGTHPAVILDGAQRFAADPNLTPEFTPHPTTWLNQGRWDDDPLPARRSQASAGERLAHVIALGRDMEGALEQNHPGIGPSSPVSGPAAITGPDRTQDGTEAPSAARRLREMEGGW